MQDGLLNVMLVPFCKLAAFIDVSPINGKTRDGLPDRITQYFSCKIAGMAVAAGDFIQHVAEHRNFARQSHVHHTHLALINECRNIQGCVDEPLVDSGKSTLISSIDPQSLYQVCELVA